MPSDPCPTDRIHASMIPMTRRVRPERTPLHRQHDAEAGRRALGLDGRSRREIHHDSDDIDSRSGQSTFNGTTRCEIFPQSLGCLNRLRVSHPNPSFFRNPSHPREGAKIRSKRYRAALLPSLCQQHCHDNPMPHRCPKKKHTPAGIPTWSPTVVLISRFVA